MAVGQDVLTQIQALIAQGAAANMVYVKLTTPIGVATVDPFAAAQDPTTQSIMQRLGIGVTVGFGPPPPPQPGDASLGKNLSIIATVALGAVAMAIRPKLSTALVVGGAALAYHSGLLGNLTSMFSSAQPAPSAMTA